MPQHPRTFSHIGLSVPDVDAAVKFYSEVLGFYVIMPATDVTEDASDIGVMCTDVFGPDWKKLRIAHLSTADRIGIEIFEFDGNYEPENNIDFRRNSTFHFCIQDPDVEGLVEDGVVAALPRRHRNVP
jgi:catechol 2,3-dioxygenase-like lactoylglutathione lyase family enzyme